MMSIVIGSLLLFFVYSKMYQKDEIDMVWAAPAKADPILHPMFDENGEAIVIDIDLGDWHCEEAIREMDRALIRMDLMIERYVDKNGPLKADDSDLSVVDYAEFMGLETLEFTTLNYLTYRMAA